MRYWAFFVGKLLAVAALSQGIYLIIAHTMPPRAADAYVQAPFAHDLWFTAEIGIWFLITCGMIYAAIWDQRYRCRVCLRRLRMPVETGSWSGMLLLGRPRIEYICPYGHGTLKEAELQISGLENPEWKPNADMWDELCAATREPDQQP